MVSTSPNDLSPKSSLHSKEEVTKYQSSKENVFRDTATNIRKILTEIQKQENIVKSLEKKLSERKISATDKQKIREKIKDIKRIINNKYSYLLQNNGSQAKQKIMSDIKDQNVKSEFNAIFKKVDELKKQKKTEQPQAVRKKKWKFQAAHIIKKHKFST